MVISKSISELMKDSSWIRAMFEEGEKMKKNSDRKIYLILPSATPLQSPRAN